MSTSIHQIIEVRVCGNWIYVPLADKVTERNDTLEQCGSVRDLFACKWHGAEDYTNQGIPDDISKEAREAMIYEDYDFINSGACWITWQQYEALTESLRQKMLNDIERLAGAKMETNVSRRLNRIENILLNKESVENAEDDHSDEDDYSDEEYVREDLEDHMWAWCCAERNMAEIEAYVDRYFNQDHPYPDFPGMDSGVRIIMYVS